MVAHVADVHPAGAHAGPAVVAAALIHLNADDVEPAEQAVDRPQGAEKAAKAPVAEDAAQADHHQDDPFPGEQDAQHAVIIRPGGVGQMADRPLEGARRADVLAEGRQGQVVPQAVPQGNGDHEHRQDHVFEPGQGPGHAAFAELQGGDFVQQLLDQPQGAEPPADGAAQNDPEQQEDAQHIPPGPVAGGAQGVLDAAQGAGGHGPGAGIAVKAGGAGVFGVPVINIPLDKAFQIGVVQQGRIQLHQPSGGGAVALPPGGFHLIQGRHTPYKLIWL